MRVLLILTTNMGALLVLTMKIVTLVEPQRAIESVMSAPPAISGIQAVITMKVTAYCPCGKCCGSWANGGPNRKVKLGRSVSDPGGVAADPALLPYGTILWIPGAGACIVDDTGGAMRQNAEENNRRIDLRFPTHGEALEWGIKQLEVAILDPEN